MKSIRERRKSPLLTISAISLALFCAVLVPIISSSSASAAFGDSNYQGYFYNKTQTSGNKVVNTGVPSSINSAAEFKSWVNSLRQSNNAQERTAGTYIITYMLFGKNAPANKKAAADANLAAWYSMIDGLAAGGNITWFWTTPSNFNCRNTFYQTSHQDVADYNDCAGTRGQSAIRFIDPSGGPGFVLKRACANPIGPLSNSDMPTGWKLDGNSYVSQPSASMNETVTFKHGVRNVNPGNRIWVEANYTWRVTGTSTPVNANSWSNNGLPINGVANVGRNEARPEANDYPGNYPGPSKYTIPGNLNAREQYCQRIEYNNANGPGTTPYPNPANSVRACVEVEGWRLDRNSYVTQSSNPGGFSSNITAKPGDTVIFKHGVRNVNPSSINSAIKWGKATYFWRVQSSTTPNDQSTWAQNGLPDGLPTLVNPNTASPLADNYPSTYTGKSRYTIPAGAADGSVYCQRIETNNANGPNTTSYPNAAHSDRACVTVDNPGWNLTGASVVGKQGGSFGSSVQARAGEQVIFKHGVLNAAGQPASYTWTVQKNANSGSMTNTSATGSPSRVAAGTWSPSLDSYVATYPGTANFTVPTNAHIGDKYCQRITYNNAAGLGVGTGSSSEACVTVQEGFGVEPVPFAELNPTGEDPSKLDYKGEVKVTGLDSSRSVNVTWVACVYKGTRPEANICTGTNLVPQTQGVTNIPAGGGSRVVLPAGSIPKASLGSLNAGDQYCTRVWVSFTTGSMDGTGAVSGTSTPRALDSCDTVHNKPYFKVYGSGVYVGGEFKDIAGTCRASGAGKGLLGAWYKNSSPDSKGASSELSAIAVAKIVGYASARTVAGTAKLPYNLSFANSSKTPANSTGAESPELGGDFDAGNCMTSVDEPDTTSPVSGTITPGTAGAFKGTNDLVINGNSNFTGSQSVFVNGDVYISGNIKYNQAGWTADTTPSFVVKVTNGNIYIDPSVTELDGLYIAQGTSSGTKGKIFTCAVNDSGAFKPVGNSNIYSTCKNQLLVHGSFVADQVNLMRTLGSLRSASNDDRRTSGNKSGCANPGGVFTMQKSCAAEVFDFSPELYLSNPAVKKRGNGVQQYDAITSLPPVL